MKKRYGYGRVLLHCLAGIVTGGLWFVVLIVRWLLNAGR